LLRVGNLVGRWLRGMVLRGLTFWAAKLEWDTAIWVGSPPRGGGGL
jgi:hypothetical protein